MRSDRYLNRINMCKYMCKSVCFGLRTCLFCCFVCVSHPSQFKGYLVFQSIKDLDILINDPVWGPHLFYTVVLDKPTSLHPCGWLLKSVAIEPMNMKILRKNTYKRFSLHIGSLMYVHGQYTRCRRLIFRSMEL